MSGPYGTYAPISNFGIGRAGKLIDCLNGGIQRFGHDTEGYALGTFNAFAPELCKMNEFGSGLSHHYPYGGEPLPVDPHLEHYGGGNPYFT
ncbi:MAG: hypothetical protein KTR14_01210 [Vampirovibrio sp.]|nr:hypothetical protein [Vampirovibrio sp.]